MHPSPCMLQAVTANLGRLFPGMPNPPTSCMHSRELVHVWARAHNFQLTSPTCETETCVCALAPYSTRTALEHSAECIRTALEVGRSAPYSIHPPIHPNHPSIPLVPCSLEWGVAAVSRKGVPVRGQFPVPPVVYQPVNRQLSPAPVVNQSI